MKNLRSIASLSLFATNTVIMCSTLYFFALMKLLIPISSFRDWCSVKLTEIAEAWISVNNWNSKFVHPVQWDISLPEELERSSSYLVLANHRSWIDIFVLQKVFNRKIPFLRFFIKKELIWTPFLGLAWWALDFPRVSRFSKEFLAKNPHKKGMDLLATRRACQKFMKNPTGILNFVEGTRLTVEKYEKSKSPFKELLPPKTGGVATVLQAMGEKFESVLDVTIIYPEGAKSLFGLLCGEVSRVIVRVKKYEVPLNLLEGLRANDSSAYESLKEWLQEIWLEKDQLLISELS